MMTNLLCFSSYSKNKYTETEPPNKEVKGVGLISCDAVTQISIQNNMEFMIESVNLS
jgi:hypothetical protein